MIPVIFIHFGEIPHYLIRALHQAGKYNKSVILLCDSNIDNDTINCFSINNYLEGIDDFVSNYLHMSSNSTEFELMCIKRWFILRNFVNTKNIDICYYSDSDVMLYDNVGKVFENYKNYDASYTLTELQNDYRWAASACCSYWKKKTINNFCDFIMDSYINSSSILKEKWQYHLDNKLSGGVCDMTLLYLFSKKIKFISLSKESNGVCFDHNMLDSENYFKNEYEMVDRRGENRKQKRIFWVKGLPYGYNNVYKKKVRFVNLTEYAKLLNQNKTFYTVVTGKIKTTIKRIVKNK